MADLSMISSNRIIFFPRPRRLSDHINSRIRSLDINRVTVDKILSQSRLRLVAKPQNLPNTRRNTNLIIDTDKGKMVLKKYRPDWKPSTIEFEHSILQKLKDENFPAPRLVMFPDGNTWLNFDGQNFCLFEFIDGRNYSSSFLFRAHRVRMMATSGRTLASLHKQLAGFQPQGQHHLGFKSFHENRLRDVEWHGRKIEELSNLSSKIREPEDKEHARWLIEKGNDLFEDMRELNQILQSDLLPRIIIHGDYGLHNLIYTDLDHAIPVDYELARIEWRLSDLVSVISKFRYKDGRYDFESITRFLHSYQEAYPIDDTEWQKFPLVWKYYKLMKGVQYWISYFETSGPVRKLLSSKSEIVHSNWALENPARLTEFRINNR